MTALGMLSQEALAELVDLVATELERRGRESAPSAPTSRWLSVEEAAAYLRCKPQRIYKLCCERRLTAFKDGSRSLFKREELDSILTTA